MKQGQFEAASQLSQECYTLIQQNTKPNYYLYSSVYDSHLAGIAWSKGDTQNACRYFSQALGNVKSFIEYNRSIFGSFRKAIFSPVFTDISRFLAANGFMQKALELAEMILNTPSLDAWERKEALDVVAGLEFEIPPEIASAARESGWVSDLAATIDELIAAWKEDELS